MEATSTSAPSIAPMACPFEPTVHLHSPQVTPEIATTIATLRSSLADEEVYQKYLDSWCSDAQLHRFLIARNYDIPKTREMLLSALNWRLNRVPVAGVESLPGWEEKMSLEGETGKIYIPGFDKYNRPVLVFDNTVQNTSNTDNQLAFLAWYLEYACRLMPAGRDKYVIFMHLENFSFFNCPPMKSIMETIFMVCTAFPERLGHCICYRGPGVFKTVFNTVKGFIDPKTVSKVVFITGSDVGEGSENDRKLKEIIGDNWKELCGGEQPVLKKGSSPGYLHDTHWPMTMQRYQEMLQKEQAKRANPATPDEELNETVFSLSEVAITEATDNSHFTVDALHTPVLAEDDESVPEEFRQLQHDYELQKKAQKQIQESEEPV
jgi:hypothetical protein